MFGDTNCLPVRTAWTRSTKWSPTLELWVSSTSPSSTTTTTTTVPAPPLAKVHGEAEGAGCLATNWREAWLSRIFWTTSTNRSASAEQPVRESLLRRNTRRQGSERGKCKYFKWNLSSGASYSAIIRGIGTPWLPPLPVVSCREAGSLRASHCLNQTSQDTLLLLVIVAQSPSLANTWILLPKNKKDFITQNTWLGSWQSSADHRVTKQTCKQTSHKALDLNIQTFPVQSTVSCLRQHLAKYFELLSTVTDVWEKC